MVKKLNFINLAPKDDLDFNEEYNAYFQALNYALQENKIKNIAITGCFSSGKSSIVNSFFKDDENNKNEFLKISLSNFLSLHNGEFKINNELDIDSNNIEVINRYEQLIEKSVLQQIFYSVSADKVPNSLIRNKTIVDEKKINWITFSLYSIAIILLFFFFSNKTAIVEDLSKIFNLYNYSDRIMPHIIFFISILFLLFFIQKLVIWIRYYFSISKIKFFDTEVEISNHSHESIFNKYLDEIIYFFSVTDYKVIIFEDLERFEKINIFSKLRELNIILNNNEKIKNEKVIKFIYAVNDELLTDGQERVKFFDFIIPVLPVLTSSNAKKYIIDLLNKINTGDDKISTEFIESLAFYISDMRIMKNIINEYLLFRSSKHFIEIKSHNKKYKENNDSKFNKCGKLENLFALVVIKNCFPSDFVNLQNKNSFFYDLIFFNTEFKIECIKKRVTKIEENLLELLESIETDDGLFDFLIQYENNFIDLSEKEKKILLDIPKWNIQKVIDDLDIDTIIKKYPEYYNRKLLFFMLQEGILDENFIFCLSFYFPSYFLTDISHSNEKQDIHENKTEVRNQNFNNNKTLEKNKIFKKHNDNNLEYLILEYPPNPIKSFTGRRFEINYLHQELLKSNLLITGIGGIGKTEICRYYVKQYNEYYKNIGWFDFDQNIKQTLLNYSKNNNNETNIDLKYTKIVNDLFLLDNNSLLIFDNVTQLTDEEIKLFGQLKSKIIITTRNKFNLNNFFEFNLYFLSMQECKELFKNFIDYPLSADEESTLAEIITMAGYHTLSIILLANIYSNSFQYANLHELLSDLKAKGFDIQSDLIIHRENHQVFSGLFKHLQKLFDISNIYDSEQLHILTNLCILPSSPIEGKKIMLWLDLENQNAINELVKTGWVQKQLSYISIHNVLAETLKLGLTPSFKECENLIQSLAEEINYDSSDINRYNPRFFPHCENVAQYFSAQQEEQGALAFLYHNIARIYEAKGEYELSLNWNLKALAIRKKILEKNHPDIASSLNNIAGIYNVMGNYPTALMEYKKAIRIVEEKLGNNHPDIGTTYNNIALVYRIQGDYAQALAFYQKALAIFKKVLGKEHPHTATTYNNIAGVYRAQGDYIQALAFYQKALASFKKVLGEEHPDTATTYNNIAEVYRAQADYSQALAFYQKALAIREKVFEEEHPDMATTYNNIAEVYRAQGDYSQALAFYQKALVIFKKVFEEEHPYTATTYNNIAGVYADMGDYSQALAFYQKALVIVEKVLGKQHPSIGTTYNNIAEVYGAQGNYPQALEGYQKAVLIFYKRLGEAHPNTKIVRDNMQSTYLALGHTEQEFTQYLSDLLSNLASPPTQED